MPKVEKIGQFNPSNNSSTGGFLGPKGGSAIPREDIALQDFLQLTISGVTGVNGADVRPRWQSIPPNLDDLKGIKTWISYGLTSRRASTNGFEGYDRSGNYIQKRNENIDVLVNIYGSRADEVALYFRQGLELSQNRELLLASRYDSKYVGEAIYVPEYINNLWVPRVDISWRISREVAIIYDILPITNVPGTITVDSPPKVIPFIN